MGQRQTTKNRQKTSKPGARGQRVRHGEQTPGLVTRRFLRSLSLFLSLFLSFSLSFLCLACCPLLSAAADVFLALPLLLAARPLPWPGKERPSDSASFSLLLSVTLGTEETSGRRKRDKTKVFQLLHTICSV